MQIAESRVMNHACFGSFTFISVPASYFLPEILLVIFSMPLIMLTGYMNDPLAIKAHNVTKFIKGHVILYVA